jgi:hypothetical protein
MFSIALAVVFIVLFLLAAACTEHGNDIGTVLLTVVGLALAFFVSWTNPIALVITYLPQLLEGIVAWFVIGAIWSMFKWWRYTSSTKAKAAIADAYSLYKKDNFTGGKSFADSSYNKWSVTKNKGRLVRWIVCWPFSVAWTATHDLISKVGTWIYEALGNVYSAISHRSIDSVTKEADSKAPNASNVTSTSVQYVGTLTTVLSASANT